MPQLKITLFHLIKSGIIKPGIGVLKIAHKNTNIATANLNSDGTVTWGTHTNISLNKFGELVMARNTNAWVTVTYNDDLLDEYREEYKLLIEPKKPPFNIPPRLYEDDFFGHTYKGRRWALDILANILKNDPSVDVSKAKYVYSVMDKLIEESRL